MGLGEKTLGMAKLRRPRAIEGNEDLEATWARTRGNVQESAVGVAGGILSLDRGSTVRSKRGRSERQGGKKRGGEDERERRGMKSREIPYPP